MLLFQSHIKLYFNEGWNCLAKKKVNANYSHYFLNAEVYIVLHSIYSFTDSANSKRSLKTTKDVLPIHELNMTSPKKI